MIKKTCLTVLAFCLAISMNAQDPLPRYRAHGNPIFTHKYTCDPAAMVKGDTLWLFTGQDVAGNQMGYHLTDWCAFSTTDMQTWTEHPTPLKSTDFSWNVTNDAWAAHVAERNGKYYYYISTSGAGIGVAVSDRPEGPYKDALGKPLLTKDDCEGADHGWVCIDPAVFIDDDGQAYIFWGNRYCYYAKLKENMIEIDGEITKLEFDQRWPFTEAAWVHKANGKYYLTYATGWPEKMAYAMADDINGPWEFKGLVSECASNCNTTHPAIVEHKGRTYMFTHNGTLPQGTSYSRSVTVEEVKYNPDGTMQKCDMTTEGINGGFDTCSSCGESCPLANDDAYLFVYFTDPTHSLFMATSYDGYTFMAVNGGKPVINGRDVAEQQGIRDPHITRGPDGAFYLAMTDLHIFAQREGLRETEWERDGAQYGWGNNRGLVLMKSYDLVNWTRSNVRIDKAFRKKFGNIGCAWAPETVYDAKKDRMMIYFTMRIGNGPNKLYYAYTNKDFTKIVTEPKLLFEHPDPAVTVLDADITQLPDGRYCMMYVAHDNGIGIKMAFSDKINEGYEYCDRWIDYEATACEAPNVWKRGDKWVLMYDIYGIDPHNFGFVETEDFKSFTSLGRFNEGVMKTVNFTSPKHGAVIRISKEEARRLEEHYK